jgi:hypothetical protein
MKQLLIFIFIFSLGSAYSQVTFFGTINRNYKLSFNQSYYNNLPINGTLDFPEFSTVQSYITFDQPKRIAISLGLEYKKHRFYIESLNDAVSSQSILNVRYYDPVSNSYINYSSNSKDRTFQKRFSLNYEYQFFGKNEKTNFFINGSIGLCHRAGPKEISPAGTMSSNLNFSPSLQMSFSSSAFSAVTKNAFNFGLGIGSDLFYKKHYILSISARFAYSKQSLYFNENTIKVYKPNTTQEYKINQDFLCSGIYFGISRNFQLFPWKPIKCDVFKPKDH